MSGILLTQNSTFIIGPVAKILGFLMNGIFNVLSFISLPNVGLSIILFTVVIYLLMTPLTIKQQKFSKLSAKMNPELQSIRKKYNNKKDNDSMMAMNQETQAVYAKYGVSPTGSCVQLLIQMPILFALYRVIYAMPAYVTKMKEAFFPLVDELIASPGSAEFLQTFKNSISFTKQFSNESFTSGVTEFVQNTYIDVLNMASSTEWNSIVEKFPDLSTGVANTLSKLDRYNNFLGLNIADSPSYLVNSAWSGKEEGFIFIIIGALMIPFLAALTQWLNVKLMPQSATGDNDQMAKQMNMMNNFMPIMSAVFCFTLPAGMGIYWIAGAVIRSVQQILINKHIDKIDLDSLIKANTEKYNKKVEKMGLPGQKISANAKINTKTVDAVSNKPQKPELTVEEKEAAVKKATEYYSNNAKSGSMAAKANMVKQYNERNNK